MTKEEFMAKLQMVYVGDKNAFNELVTAYDDLQQRIDKAIDYIQECTMFNTYMGTDINCDKLIKILQGEEVK